ncbi:MAG TPA: GNAT family protein [Actinomycetota bacterium]
MRIEPLFDPPPDAERVVIRGERVVLRPYRAEDLDVWFDARMAQADDRTISPVGKPDRERLQARVERSGLLHQGWLDLAIELDGRLVGEIGTYGGEPGREVRPGTYFFGIGLFDVADRGHGLGTDATRALCGWLFREAGADRVESSTAVSNAPMRGVFERLGFHFDGVERRWEVDWAQYSVDRDDWPAPREPRG